MQAFADTFSGKRVLVLGHTGFKGSWLTLWLNKLNAKVYGVSIDVPTDPSHFELARIEEVCDSHFVDIRDYQKLSGCFDEIRPDFVFHLAAQALVGRAYDNPLETFQTNLLGTVNVLECLRRSEKPLVAVFITSDKAYDNVEMVHGYRETDRIGGKDPYSASKGCAEIAIRSYAMSFLSGEGEKVKLGVARAGNVIGGGDWSEGRLVPDIVKAWYSGQTLQIRAPSSTRPWQHVMEPLSGYLNLGQDLYRGCFQAGQQFNFGPKSEDLATVADVVESMRESLEGLRIDYKGVAPKFDEAGLLKLSCDKAQHLLRWTPVLRLDEALEFTKQWYRETQRDPASARQVSESQIDRYYQLAKDRGLAWAAN